LDELFTVQQVATKLQIHLMTVYKLISSGRLQADRIPGVGLRIEPDALRKLLSQRRRRTSAKPEK